MEAFSQTYIVLFSIITLGFILGRIKVKGISLDISAVIFVALMFGHFGFRVPKDIQFIGLTIFVFTVGIQAGPGFFRAFKSTGKQLSVIAVLLVATAGGLTVGAAYLFDIDMEIATGVFTGAMTSTPGLAVAIDTTGSSLPSIGYGVAYPFGVLGVILFAKLLPGILKSKIQSAEEELCVQQEREHPQISPRHYIVKNDHVTGKPMGELNIPAMTGANISRVKQGECAFTPTVATQLKIGDTIKAVGTDDAHEKVKVLIGDETETEIPLSTEYQVLSVLISNKEIMGKTIADLQLFARFGATITRIKRSGIYITPSDHIPLQLGDKLMIACDKGHMQQVVRLLGNNDKRLSDTDFLPIALGIIIGFFVGQIRFSVTDSFSFQLGLTGGVLFTAIVLGKLGKTGPVVWTMSGTANNLLRIIGLLFFLSAVGTQAGANIVETYEQYGFKLFAVGAAITIIPMVVAVGIAQTMFKLNLLTLLGALTGAMTSSPGLAAVDGMSESNEPHIAYATVYPVAMVSLIICVQVMGML
ncbi:MAG: transporter [Deltaproteobacteria bacterium]|nr:transporter [Deltaproteobacteria bacterium]MBN2674596.1 transporter [Deltaproteobacteria bacterium]